MISTCFQAPVLFLLIPLHLTISQHERPPDALPNAPVSNLESSLPSSTGWQLYPAAPAPAQIPWDFQEQSLLQSQFKQTLLDKNLVTQHTASDVSGTAFGYTGNLPQPAINNAVHFQSYDLHKTLEQANIEPEALMTVPEIVQYWGYPIEEHKVVTSDGYVLTLHRIPHGRSNFPMRFIFADEGFDVWLGNVRGNLYSKNHNCLCSGSSDFWNFSWEEMAKYDLPAMIDYVLCKTGQSSLYYVGHSQGVLTMLSKLSQDQHFARKIRKFFALAPASCTCHVKGRLAQAEPMYEKFRLDYELLGDREVLSSNAAINALTDFICDTTVNSVCQDFLFSILGPNSCQFNSTRIGVYLAHNLAGTSTKNMLHFAQMIHSKRLASFDYGEEANIRCYGKNSPPEYSFSNIHCDIYIFYSDGDWVVTNEDVEQFLIPALPRTSVKLARKLYGFNHNDFLWGLRARSEIYDPIINIVRTDYT